MLVPLSLVIFVIFGTALRRVTGELVEVQSRMACKGGSNISQVS